MNWTLLRSGLRCWFPALPLVRVGVALAVTAAPVIVVFGNAQKVGSEDIRK